MITLDQAHYAEVVDNLSKLNIRGFTSWREVFGRGSETGEPHYGTHAWPSVNNAILAIVNDHQVQPLLAYLKELDTKYGNLGLRAFVWNVEDMI